MKGENKMKIDWQIRKKRGNFRPRLSYELTLETFEKKLAIHAVQVESLIPVIPKSHLSYCMPGENERDASWTPDRFHTLQVPYFKEGVLAGFIRLPFRDANEYPEVEASFRKLRDEYEIKVRKAYASGPINQAGSLDISKRTQGQISAKVTADRLLSMFG